MNKAQQETSVQDSVYTFWFEELTPEQHFAKDDAMDARIARRFENTVQCVLQGAHDSWQDTPRGLLALIICSDQFTRNIFRDTPKAFSGDAKALAWSLFAVARGDLENSTAMERMFLLMPMMHSEDLSIQEASLPLFARHTPERTYDYAKQHYDIIKKFGRFPHRNSILSRTSTEAEKDFLKGENSSF